MCRTFCKSQGLLASCSALLVEIDREGVTGDIDRHKAVDVHPVVVPPGLGSVRARSRISGDEFFKLMSDRRDA